VDLYRRINEDVYQHIVPETDDLLKRSHRIFHPPDQLQPNVAGPAHYARDIAAGFLDIKSF
jgi:hypothetical protein